MPQVIAAFQEKLAPRLREALAGGDDERIRQEVALFASKIDVDEELSRLATHVAEVKRILDEGGAVGKRLDFLMQELNREANTLGSKSVDIDVTQAAMELKVLIEQMREQIQNIESEGGDPDVRNALHRQRAFRRPGKTSLLKKALEAEPDVALSISHTTRPPRPGEVDGRDYHFVPVPDFENMLAAGEFLESASIYGNRYGTWRKGIEQELRRGTRRGARDRLAGRRSRCASSCRMS